MNGGGYMCVDLRTGEEIWFNEEMGAPGSGVAIPAFGYDYALHQENWHGVIPPGILFSSGFGSAFNPLTGENLFNVTGVPSGTEIVGTNGEILRLQLNSVGKWLAQWNSSRMWTTGIVPAINTNSTGWVNASMSSRYDWNITLSALGPGTWSINRVLLEDVALLTQGNFGIRGTWDGANMTVISLKPASRGQLLWTKYYPAAPENVTRSLAVVDPVNRVIVFRDKETFKFLGYSLDDGSYLWTSSLHPDTSDYEFFETGAQTADGRLYFSGYGGMLYGYDTKSGTLLWTYGNGGPGNNTNSGLQTAWGDYPIFVQAIVDGKLYLVTTEHSPNTPLYKGARVRCVDAETGKEIWTMLGYGGRHIDPPPLAVADGFLVYLNHYDMQIYCVGKGPSSLTVTAPDVAAPFGSPVVIRGTVTDIAAGTKQNEQAARFPNGVPAVSDASQSAWMEYVYMQKPKPTNATGVPVKLEVVDANGNYRTIGTAASDASGMFSYTWTPDIEGTYYVIATFEGSESYWPSNAETSFAVEPAAATPAPTQAPIQSMADTYLLPGIIGIIVAIAVVGIVLALLVTKKRP